MSKIQNALRKVRTQTRERDELHSEYEIKTCPHCGEPLTQVAEPAPTQLDLLPVPAFLRRQAD